MTGRFALKKFQKDSDLLPFLSLCWLLVKADSCQLSKLPNEQKKQKQAEQLLVFGAQQLVLVVVRDA